MLTKSQNCVNKNKAPVQLSIILAVCNFLGQKAARRFDYFRIPALWCISVCSPNCYHNGVVVETVDIEDSSHTKFMRQQSLLIPLVQNVIAV